MIFQLWQGVAPKDPFIIGAKAVGLIEMIELGLPVPYGYCITTDSVVENDFPYLDEWMDLLNEAISSLDDGESKRKGPLLVSVRSGAPVSMPGMMDTILNVGLTRDSITSLNDAYKAPVAFGYDCYRRLISMYGTSVENIDRKAFNEYYLAARDFFIDVSQSERAVRVLVEKYETLYEKETGSAFPSSAIVQLERSVLAVFNSWNSPTAASYREMHNISHDLNTAVIVQQMVYGNINDSSSTGVVFTHNPNTGTKGWFGEYVVCAQGEDVVSGSHTTQSIEEITRNEKLNAAGKSLKSALSKLYNKKGDMLDVEFTIENGKLYILQCRPAKRSRRADVRFALDNVREGRITSEEATSRILSFLPQTEISSIDEQKVESVGLGVPVGGSIICAPIAIGQTVANEYAERGDDFIFVALETSPSDHVQMASSVGILTAQGGALSHAAVIARSWNKPCVVGCADMEVFDDFVIIGQVKLSNNDLIQINGETGEVHVVV